MKELFVKGIIGGSINMYRGCSHGCIYCDTRSTCYQVEDYDEIGVKINALQLLDEQLPKLKRKTVLHTGSMTDPYLQIEAQYKLTRGLLERVYKYGFGISLLTKSNLIMRDFDLICSINNKTAAQVCMTLTTANDELCKKLEPNVCPTSERVKVLSAFSKAGVPCCVWLSPILPFINDTEENLTSLLNMCLSAGVKSIVCFGFGVTLRSGSREYFYAQLDKFFPGMKEKYQQAFGYNYICNSEHNEKLYAIFEDFCIKNNIDYDLTKTMSFGEDAVFSDQLSFL